MNGFFFLDSKVFLIYSVLKLFDLFYRIFRNLSVSYFLSEKIKSLRVNDGSEKRSGGKVLLY